MRLACLAAVAALTALASPSRAAMVTATYNFIIPTNDCSSSDPFNGSCIGPGGVRSVLPSFSASFTVTLDTALAYPGTTANIVLNSLSGRTLDSAFGFDYTPNYGPYNLLRVGGVAGGVDVSDVTTSDFVVVLDITDPAAPLLFNCSMFNFCGGSTGDPAVLVGNSTIGDRQRLYTSLTAGSSVTAAADPAPIDPTPTAVPEPSTMLCLGTVLAGLGLARRRAAGSRGNTRSFEA